MTPEELGEEPGGEPRPHGRLGLRRRTDASRVEPIDALRDDVRLLGELVGDVLREQAGPLMYEAVEHVRTAAIALRSQRSLGLARELMLVRWMRHLSNDQLLQLVRAFSVYFHLINVAEQHHRVRTLAERERAGGPVHESIDAAVATLRQADGTTEALRAKVGRVQVRPVFTAHPS
jgi:phosphoenolpyruvate carboxylase